MTIMNHYPRQTPSPDLVERVQDDGVVEMKELPRDTDGNARVQITERYIGGTVEKVAAIKKREVDSGIRGVVYGAMLALATFGVGARSPVIRKYAGYPLAVAGMVAVASVARIVVARRVLNEIAPHGKTNSVDITYPAIVKENGCAQIASSIRQPSKVTLRFDKGVTHYCGYTASGATKTYQAMPNNEFQ